LKGIVFAGFNDAAPLQVVDRAVPEPDKGQVLVQVKASSVTIQEYNRFASLDSRGRPSLTARVMDTVLGAKGKILGNDLSGVVAAVGSEVNSLRVGDEVFGTTRNRGAWAEYAVADASSLATKPGSLTFEQAAVFPVCGVTAFGALRKAGVEEGKRVLVYGGSGGVGGFAVQFAKALGAEVTAVVSKRNIELALENGADEAIDYTQEDFSKCGKTFDAIIGANGYNHLGTYKRLLAPDGTYIAIGNAKQGVAGMLGPLFSIGSNKHMGYVIFAQEAKKGHLSSIRNLIETEQLLPRIDATFNVREADAAIKYLIGNHAQGKVAISVIFDDDSRG
jgi:NADPH:quinone reductase-like Zn-dependent oxidoreductase